MISPSHTAADPWRHHKLVAIPILALVLAIVMVRNFTGANTSPPIAPPPRPMRAPTPGTSFVAPNQAAKNSAAEWPNVSLDEIIAKNPFGPWNAVEKDRATAANQANAAQSAHTGSTNSREKQSGDERVETLSGKTVQAVYHDDIGAAAIVDSHIIRPGDKLNNGQIVNVTDDGVTVSHQQ